MSARSFPLNAEVHITPRVDLFTVRISASPPLETGAESGSSFI
ncbi:hypothetical protein [Streptomyces tritici]